MLEIPVFQDQSSDFTERITLDNVEISLRFAWNTKSQYWMLNEYKEVASGLTLNGIKMVVNFPLLYQFVTNLSGQFLIFLQNSALTTEITYSSLGEGHGLFYLSNEEFNNWKDFNGFQ